MGLFDFLINPITGAGQQAINIITAQQPTASNGAPYSSPSPSNVPNLAQQQMQQNYQNAQVSPQSFIASILESGSSQFRAISTPVVQTMSSIGSAVGPSLNMFTPVAAAISNPIFAPVGIGIGAAMAASAALNGGNISSRPQSQISDPNSAGLDIGSGGRPVNISYEQTTPRTPASFFVPIGDRSQTEIKNAKAVYDPTGGSIGIYQTPKSIYESAGGFQRVFGIETSSGGPGSLQSGMFSIGKPLTPVVYTQESGGSVLAPSANQTASAQVLSNPSSYSRLGAEAYGGTVQPLDSRILSPTAQMARYPESTGNLANLSNPTGINQPRSTWTNVPSSIDMVNSPVLQKATPMGMTALSMSELSSVGVSPTLVPVITPIGNVPSGSIAILPGKDILTQANEFVGGALGLRANAAEQPGMFTTAQQTVPATGELPFVGRVPFISDFISFVSPQQNVTTTKSVTPVPSSTIFFPSNQTAVTTTGTNTTLSSKSEPIASPLDLFLRGNMPSPGSEGSKIISELSGRFAETMPLIGIPAMAIRAETGFIDTITGGASKAYTSFVPFSRGYIEDTYKSTFESPSRALASAAVPVAIVGAGTVLRVAGAGEGILAPTSTIGGVYQTASKVATAALGGIYASDVSKRVIGVTPGEIQQKFLPSVSGNAIAPSEGFKGAISTITTKFPGLETSRQQLNVVETQELIPMTLAFAGASAIGDRIVGVANAIKYTSIGAPEIKNPTASGYTASEGFPTNPSIRTQDLIDSFNSGTITLRDTGKLSETVMAPFGKPIERIPVGTQIGAPEGKTLIYTGAEYPFLRTGHVGESSSELPAMFAAPQRISYFTKAGQSQAGGFGITSDIFGIYRAPTVYRTVTPSGEYQQIPERLLNAQNPTNPVSGKPYGINDPMNPRNIAIADWIRTEAKPGVPIISQYGKSEWQYLIPAGSEVGSQKVTGFYREGGVTIPQVDVTFSGRRSPDYKIPEYRDPLTGEKLTEVGKNYATMSATSSAESLGSRKIVPFVSYPTSNVDISRYASYAKSVRTYTQPQYTSRQQTSQTKVSSTPEIMTYLTPSKSSYTSGSSSRQISYPRSYQQSYARTSPSASSYRSQSYVSSSNQRSTSLGYTEQTSSRGSSTQQPYNYSRTFTYPATTTTTIVRYPTTYPFKLDSGGGGGGTLKGSRKFINRYFVGVGLGNLDFARQIEFEKRKRSKK